MMKNWGIRAWIAGAVVLAGTSAGADAFDEMISPVSNPVVFEDARATTEVRPIFLYHDINRGFANEVNLGGGSAYVAAVQIRLALTDRLAIIATKDGYVWLRPENEVKGAVESDDGPANIAFGAKFSFWYDEASRTIGTFGLRYEAPTGDAQVLQGKVFRQSVPGLIHNEHGDGIINPFLSGSAAIDALHFAAYAGPRLAIDGIDSSFFDTSLHADYRLGRFYPLLEVNWVHCLDAGRRVPLEQEGFDFFNLGSSKAGGSDVVTMAAGTRVRLLDDLEIRGLNGGLDWGAAYEFPLTLDNKDIFGWRVTTDLIFWLR